MATLSSCGTAALRPPARVDRDRLAPPSNGNRPGQDSRRRESENLSGALPTAINLAIALLTIVGVGAFYGLLMLGMGEFPTAAHLSPYAAFYGAGQNPWIQITTGPAQAKSAAPAWSLARPTR